MTKDLTPFDKPPAEDWIEPELVDDGSGSRARRRGPDRAAPERDAGTGGVPPAGGLLYEAFARLKFLFVAAVLLISFALVALGAVLTSTLIGAVIGIPLILLGFAPLWLLFRLFSSGGKKGTYIFRRF